jgi:mycothiol maleylpyruvate isomerase-like protein
MDCDGAVRPAQACLYRRSRSARRPFIMRGQSARPARGALDGSRAELAVITEQRLGLASLLEGLSDDEWEQPSLCAGWRIRDVAAHVAMAPQIPGLVPMLADGIRALGTFHRLSHDIALRHAAPQRTSLPSCARTRILAGYRW